MRIKITCFRTVIFLLKQCKTALWRQGEDLHKTMKINFLFFLLLLANAIHAQNNLVNGDANDQAKFILTPKPLAAPRLNNALVYGCRPGNDFLYRVSCQGERPLKFSAKGLPPGLTLDENSGIIKGSAPARGTYIVTLKAKNKKGSASREFKIISGDKIGLTPPMGWNDWYAHYDRISDKLMREAADVMISKGMADVGYSYVNIDDCWTVSTPGNKMMKKDDGTRYGTQRMPDGTIIPNIHFPDMKGMTDYIHSKGLKAGIYSSPGPRTCMNFTGSYGHEKQDAEQYAKWGFDFLKYDWCSYWDVAGKERNLETYQKPYKLMGDILKSINRDIFYNMCQYGMGDSWKWAASVGGNSWRTAGDLGIKELDKIFDIALRNASFRDYNKPGEWNDPDYISIGYIGSNIDRSNPQLTKMSPWLQYSYMSLWSLMASPLFYGGDMSKLDDFTLNVLCNPEIIAINQDPLGQCAKVTMRDGDKQFIMVKDLYDGSKAVGLFNREKTPVEVSATWQEIAVQGLQKVRDAWRMKNLGKYRDEFKSIIPAQGCMVIKISQ
jgi:alpha-galactosidase